MGTLSTLLRYFLSASSRNSENSVRAVLKEAAGKPNGELDAGRALPWRKCL